MSMLFKQFTTLDVATDPCDLAETKGSVLTNTVGSTISGAMQRCKNLRLDQEGVLKTRDGSSKLNSTAMETGAGFIIEQGGYRYAFAGTQIYRNETSISTGLTNAAWSALLYNQYNDTDQQVFAVNGADRKRINGANVYEWGIEAPTTAPTLAAGASTGLTGDYNAKYTYCRKVGTTVVSESDPSPAGAAAVTLSDGSLSVTWKASTDSQVTHVRIYRTLTDGTSYYHDQDVAIGTTTLDTTTADGSLGDEVATDHDRPPYGTYCCGPNYNGTCFMIYSNLLYYSLPKQPEYWPSTYYIEVSPPQHPGQCIVFYNGAPYFLSKHEIYHIQGTGHLSFFPYRMNALTGAQGPQCAVSVHGRGIYHVGSDGLYLFNGSSDTKVSDKHFSPIFRGETVNGMPGAVNMSRSWLIQAGNKLYWGYASDGHAYPSNVLCINMDTARTAYYDYGTEFRTVAYDDTNDRILAGDDGGYIWRIEEKGTTTDNGTAIAWEVESKAYTLQTRAHFPRTIKWDVDASTAASANGELILDGSVHQTHALSGTRVTKKRLVDTGNGRRASIRLSGSGPVSIYAVEAE